MNIIRIYTARVLFAFCATLIVLTGCMPLNKVLIGMNNWKEAPTQAQQVSASKKF